MEESDKLGTRIFSLAKLAFVDSPTGCFSEDFLLLLLLDLLSNLIFFLGGGLLPGVRVEVEGSVLLTDIWSEVTEDNDTITDFFLTIVFSMSLM